MRALAWNSKVPRGLGAPLLSMWKAMEEQRRLLLLRFLRYFPNVPLPMREPPIGWWLARNDACGHAMVRGAYETRERQFVECVLRPGMTVLDIGAHHGLYTLLASRQVGAHGRVLAFEPSERERNNLLTHLRLNRCRNVEVEAIALGSECARGELFVIDGTETGCNCLRPPCVAEPTTRVPVSLETLDGYMARRGIDHADFVKLDVEGGELGVLKGATRLLSNPGRPIILVEVQDLRTEPWGYGAREIVEFLLPYDYCWFRFADIGLQPVRDETESFNENLLAIPKEQELVAASFRLSNDVDAQAC